jgi:hypothetical protein
MASRFEVERLPRRQAIVHVCRMNISSSLSHSVTLLGMPPPYFPAASLAVMPAPPPREPERKPRDAAESGASRAASPNYSPAAGVLAVVGFAVGMMAVVAGAVLVFSGTWVLLLAVLRPEDGAAFFIIPAFVSGVLR